MKLVSIELFEYSRISLGGTNYIKLTPNLDLQLILGTNGSGKSSFLNEITPLPSSPLHYSKEGYSVKVFSHNGFLYELKSTFNPKQEHSFIKDGIELNLGRSVTVQKELVKQEFGITPEIHELIMGRDKFTQMSPSQRRYWLTQLSNVSYDYAISVYNRLKEKLRDTTGALKIARNRFVNETSKMISVEEQNGLKNEVMEMHEFLSHITEFRKPIDKDLTSINDGIIKHNLSINKTSLQLIKLINKTKLNNKYGDNETVTQTIHQLSSEETVNNILLEKLYERIVKINENIAILDKTGNQGIEDLEFKLDSLKQLQITTLLGKLLNKSPHRSPLEALRAIQICKSTLDTIFTEMPSNSDLKYSSDKKNILVNKLGQLIDKRDKLKLEINRLTLKKAHLEDHKDKSNLVCPHCSKNINFNFSASDYERSIVLIDQYSQDVINLDKDKITLDNDLADINNYIETYNRYRTIRNSYPVLEELWVLIDSKIIYNPNQCIIIVESFHSDLVADKKHNETEIEIKDIQNLIIAKRLIGDQDSNKLKDEHDIIEKDIFEKQTKSSINKNELKKLIQYKKDLEFIESINKDLIIQSDSLQVLVDDKIETMRRQTVNDGIRYVQSMLSRKESILLDLNNQENIVKDLSISISQFEYDEKCLKALVNELSPTDGLIAEGLFGFIKIFINQMNSFIKKVWTYDMKIESCELTDSSKVELDYKFPLRIEGKEKPVPDIAMGSSSMLEIIDLSFKIMAIKHLGLNDIPLFLDEFGTGFDKTHRTTVYGIFDYLMNQIQFNQVFIVNHYSDLYGSFNNAEIFVLHDTNIEIPKGAIYNKHVSLA